MRVTILHQAIAPEASEDEKDVLLQVESVCRSLERLGHRVQIAEATLNLEQTRLDLLGTDPDCVFYLVESLDGTDSLAHLPAFLLDTMQISYTGAPALALVLSNNKIRAKREMALVGLPTPGWLEPNPGHLTIEPSAAACSQTVPAAPLPDHCAGAGGDAQLEGRGVPKLRFPAKFIIKPIEEHASLGMTDDCIVEAEDEPQLREHLQARTNLLDRACFAEEFIDGREFNLAVLGTPEGPIVLPPAEIDFAAFPAGKPHIVGYDAKWAAGSFEYENTPRRFLGTASADDAELGKHLVELAAACWKAFGLRGYARVDFRVDTAGNPWILEVNANPCLSPDAGFAAALEQAGIPMDHAVQSILDNTDNL